LSSLANIGLTEFLEELIADCDGKRALGLRDRCGARFEF
jgi:hypothetical protein